MSINISVYNCGPYIAQTLDSVLAQTYQDWECIIVDDASTDDSLKQIQPYLDRDSRFKLHRMDAATKEPYPACRNKAVALSVGRWIAPLDGDDWWEPWKLERQVALAESEPGIKICCAGAHIWTDGKVVAQSPRYTREQVLDILPKHSMTVHPAVLLDRKAMVELGMYDLQMKTAQDWDLWLKFLWKYGPQAFTFLPEPCMYYRRHDKNVTNNLLKCSKHEWIIIRRTLKRYGWGLKNPVRTWRVLDYWLLHDAQNFHEAGLQGLALGRILPSLLLHPLGGWRYKLLVRILRRLAKSKPKAQAA